MSAKDFLVVGHLAHGEPHLIRPNKDGETHFSKKEAQRVAQAHISDGILKRAEIVQVVMEVNSGD